MVINYIKILRRNTAKFIKPLSKTKSIRVYYKTTVPFSPIKNNNNVRWWTWCFCLNEMSSHSFITRYFSDICCNETNLKVSTLVCIVCVCLCSVIQSCLILCNPVDCFPPCSSVHEIIQARILQWVAMPTSMGSSRPRDRTYVFTSPALAAGIFTPEPSLHYTFILYFVLTAIFFRNIPILWLSSIPLSRINVWKEGELVDCE